jgi:16S rRNA pseudouridine516 synthase
LRWLKKPIEKMKIMIHRFLTLSGLFSSKEEIISALKNNEIKINDEIITNPKYQFNPNTKTVFWKDKKISYSKEKYYYAFNKPTGYLSTKLSEQNKRLGKKSMYDLIKIQEKIFNQLSAVGRLDEDSSGLILMTNDGKTNFKIASPKSRINKTYEAKLQNTMTDKEIKKAESGVIIDLEVNGKHFDYKTKPAKIKRISEKIIQITLTEGKKREVRRIFESLNNKVITLKRVSIGNLNLDELNIKPGELKKLDKEIILKKILN